jgi:four helix bundle protein
MTHRDLDVYKQSIKLVSDIYLLTRGFPKFEMFGLSSQMQKAAVSIPSNIAEGASRNGTKEYIHFISISIGSASELETQLQICFNLGYCMNNSMFSSLLEDIGNVRAKLIQMMKSLEKRLHQ